MLDQVVNGLIGSGPVALLLFWLLVQERKDRKAKDDRFIELSQETRDEMRSLRETIERWLENHA